MPRGRLGPVLRLHAVIAAAFVTRFAAFAAAVYLSASVAAFITYRIDKAAAERGERRISEATLLALGLIGGWPGALVAQRRFRHKTRKPSFQLAFWTTVLINCATVSLCCFPRS